LDAHEEILGHEHPVTANTYNNLANIYSSMDNFADAHQKSLNIREKVFGMEHPHTATVYNNIGFIYETQGEHIKAQEWYQKAAGIFPGTESVNDA
jgi:tetratricopeptide (TPR) repeat protein